MHPLGRRDGAAAVAAAMATADAAFDAAAVPIERRRASAPRAPEEARLAAEADEEATAKVRAKVEAEARAEANTAEAQARAEAEAEAEAAEARARAKAEVEAQAKTEVEAEVEAEAAEAEVEAGAAEATPLQRPRFDRLSGQPGGSPSPGRLQRWSSSAMELLSSIGAPATLSQPSDSPTVETPPQQQQPQSPPLPQQLAPPTPLHLTPDGRVRCTDYTLKGHTAPASVEAPPLSPPPPPPMSPAPAPAHHPLFAFAAVPAAVTCIETRSPPPRKPAAAREEASGAAGPSIPPLALERLGQQWGAGEEEARQAFAKFDCDGDGVVSRDDFRQAMREIDPTRVHDAAALDAMFDAVDTDADGLVRFEDFVRMQQQKKPRGAGGEGERGQAEREADAAAEGHARDDRRRRERAALERRASREVSPLLQTEVTLNESIVILSQRHDAGSAPAAFSLSALLRYRQLHPGGDGTLDLEGWSSLMESLARERGLRLQRPQLATLFFAADSERSGTLPLHRVLGMESVQRFLASLAQPQQPQPLRPQPLRSQPQQLTQHWQHWQHWQQNSDGAAQPLQRARSAPPVRFADSPGARRSASRRSASPSPTFGMASVARRSASLSPTPGVGGTKRGMGRQLSAPTALARFRPSSFAAGTDGVQALVRPMGRDSPLNSAEAAAADVLSSQATPLQLARAMSVDRVDRLRASMPFARKNSRVSGHTAKTAASAAAEPEERRTTAYRRWKGAK